MGEIIHNPQEIQRLIDVNLKTIELDKLNTIDRNKSVVIIRAHGEPPHTFHLFKEFGLEFIDATCPLVKGLQNKIKIFHKNNDCDWQIIIFGKKNHPEVIGLSGYCDNICLIAADIDEIIDKIDYKKNTVVFSQTTMNANSYINFQSDLKNQFLANNSVLGLVGSGGSYTCGDIKLVIQDSVCKFMKKRDSALEEFAVNNDLVIFVAGRSSSNGKVLFSICKEFNPNSIFIEHFWELDINVVRNFRSIGITGATSTPKWYIENIKERLVVVL